MRHGRRRMSRFAYSRADAEATDGVVRLAGSNAEYGAPDAEGPLQVSTSMTFRHDAATRSSVPRKSHASGEGAEMAILRRTAIPAFVVQGHHRALRNILHRPRRSAMAPATLAGVRPGQGRKPGIIGLPIFNTVKESMAGNTGQCQPRHGACAPKAGGGHHRGYRGGDGRSWSA